MILTAVPPSVELLIDEWEIEMVPGGIYVTQKDIMSGIGEKSTEWPDSDNSWR